MPPHSAHNMDMTQQDRMAWVGLGGVAGSVVGGVVGGVTQWSSAGIDHMVDRDGMSEAKRKKGNGVEGKSIEEELCRICGDRASGYHYNALSCEGCKGK